MKLKQVRRHALSQAEATCGLQTTTKVPRMRPLASFWRPLAAAGLAFLSLSAAWAASLGGLAVEVVNESEPILCAEKDNVALSMSHPAVRSLRIEAAHPVYLAPGLPDQQSDWTACDMSADPVHVASHPPREVVLYREPGLWIVGQTYPSFWRPSTATVRIGRRVEQDLHVLQVWLRRPGRAEEVLVLYPQDGYWRARPLAPPGIRPTAYGSSFLVGPVEHAGRPLVNLREVRFDPATRTFTLQFRRGGQATLKLTPGVHKTVLDVSFDTPISDGPFAMLRSMYVTEFNNDVARIAVREPDAKGWREDGIMKFDRATATDVWAGRLVPSRHNTLAPDMVFTGFSDGTAVAGRP